jgi:hypothetical protein
MAEHAVLLMLALSRNFAPRCLFGNSCLYAIFMPLLMP